MKAYEHSARDIIKFLRARNAADGPALKAANKLTRLRLKDWIRKMKFRFSNDDMNEGKELATGWRRTKTRDITEEIGKKDPTSINRVITSVISEGPDKGVVIKTWCNQSSKQGKKNWKKFVECFARDGKVEVDKEYDSDLIIGLEVDAYCSYDIQSGFNRITEWRAVPQTATAS
jgi:hypothetical protein